MDQMARHSDNGQNGRGEARAPEQLAVIDNRSGRLVERPLKPVPDEDASKEERGVMWNVEREQQVENEEKDEQLREGVQECPSDTKDGTLVAQLHVAAYQLAQQIAYIDETMPR